MADRISTLPDTVLCHILSFLPTKLAVTTSVLSKRWSPLWLSVPTLDFDDESYVKNKDTHFRFLQLVYAVMLSRDLHQPIKTFRLKCWPSLCDPSNVNIWVNAAIQRRVEHLELSLPSNFNLSSSVFSSRTLVVLKLIGLTVNALSSVDLSLLKILHLKGVNFPHRQHLWDLLSACPILEDFEIDSLKYVNFLANEKFKSLPKLVRADISTITIPLKGIYNVQFLRIEVVMYPCFSDIPAFNNLTHLELTVWFYYWDWLIEVLKNCHKLQILVIDKMSMDPSARESEVICWVYPPFVPGCLSSHLRTCSLKNYDGMDCEFQFARYIMQNARVLGIMTICSTSYSNLQEKFQMIKNLSSCSRISATCKLLFE